MTRTPGSGRVRGELLALVRRVPAGRVVTLDVLAAYLKEPPALVVTLLSQLNSDETEMAPWHRVVAKGGALGRGPHREAQFARLLREGVLVSPAGIVQDLARVALSDLTGSTPAAPLAPAAAAPAGAPVSRSRGMRARPGGGVA